MEPPLFLHVSRQQVPVPVVGEQVVGVQCVLRYSNKMRGQRNKRAKKEAEDLKEGVEVIEKMLKCLGLWQEGVRVDPQRQTGTDSPPGDWVYEPVDQDPFPNYDTEPVLFYAEA